MKKNEIGKFYATSFDGNIIEFIVFDDYTMDCPTLNAYSYKMIELKPRFILWNDEKYYKYNVPATYQHPNFQLISNYNIDKDLFIYLKQNRMIRYSQDMAYLYEFEDKNGYDSNPNYYGVSRPYKRAKKKGPILVKQKKGQFN